MTASTDKEGTPRQRTRDAWRWLPLAAALAAVLYPLRDYLIPGTLPMRGDPSLQSAFPAGDLTPFFASFTRVSIGSMWEQGVLPFWSPLINAGSPVLEMPTAGALGLATWLGAVVRPEAAIKWSMLIHVAVGIAGVYALARRLRLAPPFCAIGALAFGWTPFLLDHFRAGHLGIVYSMPLVPWVMLCVWCALTTQRNAHRWAIGAGALLATQIVEGADSPMLYQAIALSLVMAGAAIGPDRGSYALRVASVGILVGIMSFALGAFQLLPVLSFMQLAHRGGGAAHAQGHGGLALEDALQHYPEVLEPIPGPAYLLLATIGFGALVVQSNRRAGLWLGLVFLSGFAIAYSRDVYAFLWQVLPGFSYQRIPQRALILSASVGPLLVAAGSQAAWSIARHRAGTRSAAAVTFLILAWLVIEMWGQAPRMTPMSRPEIEITSNAAMQWVDEHNDGSRMHVIESMDRHWGTEHVTVPLGLPAMISYTTAEHRDYTRFELGEPVRTFVDESYTRIGRFATFWGVLNVRYVISTHPRAIPGLTQAAKVKRCPLSICQPAKSAGPYIYENERWLPPTYRVGHAIALVGEPRATFETALDILAMPEFDPGRCVLLQIPGDAPVPVVDATIRVSGGSETSRGWGHPADRDEVRRVLALAGESPAPVAGELERPDPNTLRARAPGEGWLVLSERTSLFPGWRAWIDGSPAPILRANGVVTALALPPGAAVELRYRPPGFVAGLGLLGLGAAIALMLEIRARRRLERRPSRSAAD